MATAQDPIEQVIGKIESFGVPVTGIGERVKGIVDQVGATDPFEVFGAISELDPSQFDLGAIVGELRTRVEDLDPALRIPVMIAGGYAAARVVRFIVR